MAWIDERGVINIRVSTQVIEHFRNIARAVGVPQSQIRIQGTMVGGGFGGKEDVTVEIYLALLTQDTNGPSSWSTPARNPSPGALQTPPVRHHPPHRRQTRWSHHGAAQIDIVSDSGAYPYLSPYVLLYTTVMAPGPVSRGQPAAWTAVTVATNNPFTSAFRGFGGPQACFAYEQQMDAIADALGMDRYELRRINYLRTGDTPRPASPSRPRRGWRRRRHGRWRRWSEKTEAEAGS